MVPGYRRAISRLLPGTGRHWANFLPRAFLKMQFLPWLDTAWAAIWLRSWLHGFHSFVDRTAASRTSIRRSTLLPLLALGIFSLPMVSMHGFLIAIAIGILLMLCLVPGTACLL